MMLEALRATTRPQHQAIERNRLLSQMLRPSLTREVYLAVLARFYGFIKPLEAQLLQCASGAGCAALLSGREKAGLLEQDLAQLGVGVEALHRLPLCTDLPACERPSHCMGILYVIEGSTLGGQVIAAAVHDSLGIDAGSGCAYFTGYGRDTRERWRETCRLLEASGQGSAAVRADTLAAAADTFDKLNRWFGDS